VLITHVLQFIINTKVVEPLYHKGYNPAETGQVPQVRVMLSNINIINTYMSFNITLAPTYEDIYYR
jgi:hypothetical protein